MSSLLMHGVELPCERAIDALPPLPHWSRERWCLRMCVCVCVRLCVGVAAETWEPRQTWPGLQLENNKEKYAQTMMRQTHRRAALSAFQAEKGRKHKLGQSHIRFRKSSCPCGVMQLPRHTHQHLAPASPSSSSSASFFSPCSTACSRNSRQWSGYTCTHAHTFRSTPARIFTSGRPIPCLGLFVCFLCSPPSPHLTRALTCAAFPPLPPPPASPEA